MKINFNDKKMQFEYEFEKKDMPKIFEIRKTMATEGWKILQNYFLFDREELITKIKKATFTKIDREMLDLKAAALVGFDHAVNRPQGIISQAETYLENKKQMEEIKNESRNDDE